MPPPLPEPQTSSSAAYPTRGPDEKFCESCGAVTKINVLACPNCGKKFSSSNGLPGCAIAGIIVGVLFGGIAILGIVAAIAIPNFISYRNKAYQKIVSTEMSSLGQAEEEYFQQYGTYTTNLGALNYVPGSPGVIVEVVQADTDCFQAKGSMARLWQETWIDCDGNEELLAKGKSVDSDSWEEDLE